MHISSADIHINADRWPKGAIVYQIYPRSWQDSNADGTGDLPGITARLPYIRDLGVNAIWLSPFYPSPMADFGYDISDYCNVDPLFGTLDDFTAMLTKAHELQIKVIIDLVPNHTSDEHPWFKQSRGSRDNPYADWYVWQDAQPGSLPDHPIAPNNWLNALTGESAWEWDTARQQFYLHSFHTRQPDLNWENPAVSHAMLDIMRFWLDQGVDGFRVDAVYWMAKDPGFKDDILLPPGQARRAGKYQQYLHSNSMGWPKVYSHLASMAAVLQEPAYKPQRRFMVTEAYPQGQKSLDAYMAFYRSVDTSVAAPFNFDGLMLPWNATDWRESLKEFHTALENHSTHAIASYAFGNHDKSRLVSRLPEDAARAAAVMQLSLPGMTFIYYGEEIGMKDVPIPSEVVRDPAIETDDLNGGGRDPERTPMQWTSGKNAGFSEASTPWLPLAANYQTRNVETESTDPRSFLSLYKKLCHLRNDSDILAYGTLEVLDSGHQDVLAYTRVLDNKRTLTMVNFSDAKVVCSPPAVLHRCLVSSNARSPLLALSGAVNEIELLPYEAVLFEAAEQDAPSHQ